MGLIHEFECKYWRHHDTVLGIDEAGRGPMAGPCVVYGVMFPIGFDHDRINDSKKLSPKRRLELASLIRSHALWIHHEIIDVETIDRLNVYRATQEASLRIAKRAPTAIVLTDCMPLDIHDKTIIPITKGDQRSISIAAASILAKTHRDQIMVEYSKIYPEYGFEKHKGYGTNEHKEKLLEYGRCPIHRSTFKFKEEIQVLKNI